MQSESRLFLFGGNCPWQADQFTATDDAVRGGRSESYLAVDAAGSGDAALFHGHLDTSALGGAGFASQRTADGLAWDLSRYSGLELVVDAAASDHKRYAITLRDEPPEKTSDGRDASSVSWEADFSVADEGTLYFPWEMFAATYRGREYADAKPLKTGDVKRISFMMRSFFGKQEGDFKLRILSLTAVNYGEKD